MVSTITIPKEICECPLVVHFFPELVADTQPYTPELRDAARSLQDTLGGLDFRADPDLHEVLNDLVIKLDFVSSILDNPALGAYIENQVEHCVRQCLDRAIDGQVKKTIGETVAEDLEKRIEMGIAFHTDSSAIGRLEQSLKEARQKAEDDDHHLNQVLAKKIDKELKARHDWENTIEKTLVKAKIKIDHLMTISNELQDSGRIEMV